MALQAGIASSKVIVLVGAGLTGSIILRSGKLADLITQLQELLKGVEEIEISNYKYDPSILSAQIRQLAQEIKELNLSRPVTIFNGNANGRWAAFFAPVAAFGGLGLCYMWWKGLSFSDIMFVTKQNMKNAVETVSKQLNQLSESLTITRTVLTKRLENLDWKVDEGISDAKLIANNVQEMDSHLGKIGYDFDTLNKMMAELEGKLDRLESSQDATNSGLWHLCNFTEGFESGVRSKVAHEISLKQPKLLEEASPKGLQFLAEEKVVKNGDSERILSEKVRSKVVRTYPVGFSMARNFL